MEDLHFDSTDLAATEEFLVKAYTKMRIGGHGDGARTRVQRRWLGSVSIDNLSVTFDMQLNARPLDKLMIGRVHSGSIESRFAGVRDTLNPGEVGLLALPDEAYAGQVSRCTYEAVMLDTQELDRVATAAPDSRSSAVQITDRRPVSKAAGERLSGFVDYLRGSVLTDPDCRRSELVTSTATMHLASIVLHTFPTNAQLDVAGADRHGAKAVLLRKAIAYIDDTAHLDISIVDIARHVNMTPRGVQYMFRRELGCTPMEYVRRVRLDHSHRDLVASGPDVATVSQIATRWGFAHKGRFAQHYRLAYGESPHETLNR